jgi:iron(III) transport system substrate-binding protein
LRIILKFTVLTMRVAARRWLTTVTLIVLSLNGLACSRDRGTEIGVYSSRHYNSDQALYDEFTRQTGIRVKLLESKGTSVIERLRNEGADSPADVLILADAARLDRASDLDLFKPVRSNALEQAIPAHLRDPDLRWFGLTRRLRVPMIHKGTLVPTQVDSYTKLASPELKGQVCLRNRRSVYNQSLVAFMIDQIGAEETASWIQGLTRNLAQPVFKTDVSMIRAVARGQCGVALSNTYYLARLQAGDVGRKDAELSRAVEVVWPQPDVQVNITGGGVTRHSRQDEAAMRFLEFLATTDFKGGYAAANHEYPLIGFGDDPVLASWGTFKESQVSVARLGELNREASDLMAANGWR